MSNTYWGAPTWIFLHTFVSKIKKEHFGSHKNKLIEYIIKICSNLPCPECSQHATIFLKTIRFENVTKKEDLIEILYVFHNQVNKNLNKPEFPDEILSTYSSKDINIVFNIFNSAFLKKLPNSLMAMSHARRILLKSIKKFLDENINSFSQ
jgi:hypothetical protein